MLNEAKDLKVKRITEKRARNRTELYNALNGLNLNVTDRNAIMNIFNKSNKTVNDLKNEAVKLRNKRVAQKRTQNRSELEAILDGTNLNASNKTSILNMFNANKNATLTSLRATIEQLSKQRKIEKRFATRLEVEKYLQKIGLSNANTKTVLNKFNADNKISLKDASDEANAILIQRVMEKMAQNRENLVQHMNGLNITNANRAAILKNFESEAANLNTLKKRATNINVAVKTKAAQRQELSNYINSSGINGKAFLNKFNSGGSTLNSLKKDVDKAKALANAQSIATKKAELVTFMKNFNIPQSNKNSFVNTVGLNTNLNTIKRGIKELNAAIKNRKEQEARNRDDFSVFLNGLELTNKEKGNLLKNYNAGKTNKDAIRNRALSINAAVKAKAAQRQELSNYINSLGINGKALLNKFNSGRSTAEKLKKEADKAKALLNAKAVNAKKDDLRVYMKNTRLPNTNKQSFLNRVDVNANMNAIKREITELNKVLKSRNDEFARKKSELSVYLNGLNNLTSNQRTILLKKVTNANTNIQSLKNEGNALNKGAKNRRAAQAAAEEEKKRQEAEAKKLQDEKKLEKHLRSLKHLTSKEMEGYMTNFKNGEARIGDLIAVSKAKNTDNEKDKDALRNYVRRATIPQTKKDVYLKQLNVPHVNVTPIKGLVNANTAAQKVELEKLIRNAEAKLKLISDITANERGSFKIRLRKEPISDVLGEAEKLSSNRKGARAAKNKQTKNVAESLRVLTTLTRENRKRFMNRLPQNGAQKVVTSAVALNSERKNAIRKAESNKKIEDEKRRLEEEAQKRRNIEEARLKQVRNQKIKNVASTLQGLTSLERENRKKFMNRVAGGENANKVITNADKLQRNRVAAERVKQQKAEQDKKALEDKRRREEEEKKRVNQEKAKVAKLKSNTAQMFRGMSGLERKNRKEFMNRLEKGEDPARVLANAKARDAAKGFSFNKRPAGQVKPMTTQQRFNTPKPASGVAAAKSEIYGMRGMGVKNQQSFIRRLEKGENASRVLKDARARAQKVGSQVSKTKQQLQYNAKVRNVVRRL